MSGLRVSAAAMIVGLALIQGCGSPNRPGLEAPVPPAGSTRTIAEMLPPANWYAPNREVLLTWLDRWTRAGAPATPQVAVFDWDNTCIFGDVEETFFRYALTHLAVRVTPEDLRLLTPESVNGVVMSKDGVKFADVGADIRAAYAELRPYLRAGRVATMPDVPAYEDFRAKVGWLYEALAATPGIGEAYAYTWITFWLAGMTPAQVDMTARAAFAEALAGPIEACVWRAGTAGRAGRLEYRFVHGLRAQPEMQTLMGAIGTVGPPVYIVSASAEPIVVAAVDAMGYPVSAGSICGVRLKMKDGRYLPELVDPAEYPFTYREGKAEAIRRIIQKEPVFVAGDSEGDYAMLTAFATVQMRLVFNRNKTGDMHKLYEDALKPPAGVEWPRTLLQGRDENTGAFRAGMETVPLGKTEPTPLQTCPVVHYPACRHWIAPGSVDRIPAL